MKRRDFLQLLSVSGLACSAPIGLSKAHAATRPDQFFVTIYAEGGWDTTAFCDPKGNANRSDGNGPVNTYQTSDIGTAGNFKYAPNLVGFEENGLGAKNKTFFDKHYNNMTIINGFEALSSGHSINSAGSGNMNGLPSIGALFAASHFADSSTSYVSFGGNSATRNLVPVSKIDSKTKVSDFINPNMVHSDAAYDVFKNYRTARQDALLANEGAVVRRGAMGRLFNAVNGDASLSALDTFLPAAGLQNGINGQAEFVAAAFASGLTAAANLEVGGFDTHSNNDKYQTSNLGKMLDGVETLYAEAERHGIADRMTVYLCSEWTRTPFYNDESEGKDDYGIGSAILISPSNKNGNGLLQLTDAECNLLKVNTNNFQADENGLELSQHHIHRSLRRFLNINSDLQTAFDLPVEQDLELFL